MKLRFLYIYRKKFMKIKLCYIYQKNSNENSIIIIQKNHMKHMKHMKAQMRSS